MNDPAAQTFLGRVCVERGLSDQESVLIDARSCHLCRRIMHRLLSNSHYATFTHYKNTLHRINSLRDAQCSGSFCRKGSANRVVRLRTERGAVDSDQGAALRPPYDRIAAVKLTGVLPRCRAVVI
jgi:hypothetical protein